MDTPEDHVERLVRLGIALANDLVDHSGKTWIHLAEQQFEEEEHSLLIGACSIFLRMGFSDEDVIVILKVATATAFEIAYKGAEPLDWRLNIQ